METRRLYTDRIGRLARKRHRATYDYEQVTEVFVSPLLLHRDELESYTRDDTQMFTINPDHCR